MRSKALPLNSWTKKGSSIELRQRKNNLQKTTTNPEDSLINRKPCSSEAPQEVCEYTFGSERTIEHGMDKDPAREGMPEGNCPARKQERLRLALPVCSLGPPKKPLTCSIPSSTSKTPILTKMGLFKEQMRSFVKSVL